MTRPDVAATPETRALAEALEAIWYDTELHEAVPKFIAALDAAGWRMTPTVTVEVSTQAISADRIQSRSVFDTHLPPASARITRIDDEEDQSHDDR